MLYKNKRSFFLAFIFSLFSFYLFSQNNNSDLDKSELSPEEIGEVLLLENSIENIIEKILNKKCVNKELASNIKIKDFLEVSIKMCDQLESQIKLWDKFRKNKKFEAELLEKIKEIKLNFLYYKDRFKVDPNDWYALSSLIKDLIRTKEIEKDRVNSKIDCAKRLCILPLKYLIYNPTKYFITKVGFGFDQIIKDLFKKGTSRVLYFTSIVVLVGILRSTVYHKEDNLLDGIKWSFDSLFNFVKIFFEKSNTIEQSSPDSWDKFVKATRDFRGKMFGRPGKKILNKFFDNKNLSGAFVLFMLILLR